MDSRKRGRIGFSGSERFRVPVEGPTWTPGYKRRKPEEASQASNNDRSGSPTWDIRDDKQECLPRLSLAPQPQCFRRIDGRRSVDWHKDGKIIIAVEGAQFPADRNRLATQSPWFAALFARDIPGAPQDAPWDHNKKVLDFGCAQVVTRDGVLVTDLNGMVSLGDVEALRTVMSEGFSFPDHTPGFPTVAAVCRAANILHFPIYINYTTIYLERLFSKHIRRLRAFDPAHPRFIHATEALELGHVFGLRNTLLRAFYEVARAPEDARHLEWEEDPVNAPYVRKIQRIREVSTIIWNEAIALPPTLHLSCSAGDQCQMPRDKEQYEQLLLDKDLSPLDSAANLHTLEFMFKGYCSGRHNPCYRHWRRQCHVWSGRLWSLIGSIVHSI
ncbi:hypothetical protein HGRIS_004370 [Hohenbuehelia grisea]|uniref:BTB domain-containing protein n=1 Tax=Hohenbuehelia grisea TaxID=104357 RepID=A0ABR3JBS1_9AGAR